MAVVFSIGFLVVILLYIFFLHNKRVTVLLALLVSFAPLVLFHSKFGILPSIALVMGSLVFFAFLVLGIRRGKVVLRNSVKVKFLLVARPALPKIITGLLLFLMVVFYLSYFEWGEYNEKIGKKISDDILKSSEPALKLWFPKTSVQQSVDEFIIKVAENQVEKSQREIAVSSGRDPQAISGLLPPLEKKRVVNSLAYELKKNLEGAVGPLDSQEPVQGAFYRIVRERVQPSFEKTGFKSLIGVIISFILFTFLRSLAPLFYWLIEILTLITYKILLLTGFAYITFENSKKENIVI